MCDDASLKALRLQIDAWARHLERLNLRHKQGFVAWMARALSASEFALLLDAEIDRGALWEIYLAEMFGP